MIPKKSLGQHFLKDKNIIRKIIKEADLRKDEIALEIGAGKGELTIPLSKEAGHVIAIEKDKELCNILEEKIKEEGIRNITVINEDILKWDFSNLPKKTTVLGNIPYNISSPLIERLIENRSLIKKAIIMFQLEFAERLIASAGSKKYGAISVIVRYFADIKKLFYVSKNVFYPRPKVDSMVVMIRFKEDVEEIDEEIFKKTVHSAFAYRRKNLLNSMFRYFKSERPDLKKEQIEEAIRRCNIEPEIRAESLTVDDFLRLYFQLKEFLR